MKIADHTTLITGASRGIGKSLAEVCARKRAHLILVSRTLPKGLREDLLALGALSVRSFDFDLSKKSNVDALVSEIKTGKVNVDILINNAGLLTGGLLEEQDPDDIEQMLNVNILALIRLTRLLLPRMLERKSGVIVNNASVTGKMFFPCASTYAASKAAVIAFTESLKQELRGTGVRTVLMITPGVKTEMFDDIEKLYGGHLDTSILSSIPSLEWAEKTIDGIESGADTIWPGGSSWFGVKTASYLPDLFEKIVSSKFSRSPRGKSL